ncbi:hypothetical protein [Silvanigrella aquatica]|nr:hypothetical protein [Silvanigrella aquatica]
MFFFKIYAFASVNIISWWGYIDYELISQLSLECKSKISYDEYYSIKDFLRRYKKHNYSIIIFPAQIYNLISQEINDKGINLNDIRNEYHPEILNLFNRQVYTKNVAIYSLGITGFIYNPLHIHIDRNDEVKNIFQNAKDKKIAVIDDPIESLHLISQSTENGNDFEVEKNFNNLIKGTKYLITNDTIKIVKDKNFAFAYSWVGTSLKRMSENPHLKFTSIPKLSYISADFIATLDKNKDTECVAKKLASKEFLDPVLTRTFYFSPYGIPEKIQDKKYLSEYEDFIDNHHLLKWLPVLKKEDYQKKINLWEKIKIDMSNKI